MDSRTHRTDRLRLWTLMFLRFAAVVSVPLAFAAVVNWLDVITRSTTIAGNRSAWTTFFAFRGLQATLLAVGGVAGAVILVFYNRRIACWIVPAAKACPSCGYLVGTVVTERCPECGESVAAADGPLTKAKVG